MALFTPVLLLEPQLLSVSLAIATALLVAVEVLRVAAVPLVGPRIHRFMTAFIDSRDAGLLLVSHFSLLAGALPTHGRNMFSWLLTAVGAARGICAACHGFLHAAARQPLLPAGWSTELAPDRLLCSDFVPCKRMYQ
jgi:hypothetical protein